MRWTEDRIDSVLFELIEENPLAVRPVLKILGKRLTDEVPTLAVTLEDPPELLINPAFIEEHCKTDEHLKAALFHEFLHVILGHTMRFRTLTVVQNLALDAAINAMIYRQYGMEYASLFANYYANSTGIARLLRPITLLERQDRAERQRIDDERRNPPIEGRTRRVSVCVDTPLERAWSQLYCGFLVADDILEIAETMAPEGMGKFEPGRLLIGNHEGVGAPLGGSLGKAVQESLRQMDGSDIWRNPTEQGVGPALAPARYSAEAANLDRWKAQTMRALRKALVPGKCSSFTQPHETSYSLPVLNSRDRRAFLKAEWSAFLPAAENVSVTERPLGVANVYLDVSGSMDAEMPAVVSLLNQLRRSIRLPFWAFSDSVSPAQIIDGQLVTQSTGGTSMASVLRHLAETKPPCAVVFTDGYIEPVDLQLLARCSATSITAIITRTGQPTALHLAGIPYVQLERYPHG